MRQPEISGRAGRRCTPFFLRMIVSCTLFMCFFQLSASAKVQKSSGSEFLFDRIIVKTAEKHGLDPMLVKAVVWRESRFNALCEGTHGEAGLMQIRRPAVLDWAKANGKKAPSREDLFDPELNIEIGTWYLARAVKYWKGYPGHISLALAEYNAGRAALTANLKRSKWNTSKVFKGSSTGKYIALINSKYGEYSAAREKERVMLASMPAEDTASSVKLASR